MGEPEQQEQPRQLRQPSICTSSPWYSGCQPGQKSDGDNRDNWNICNNQKNRADQYNWEDWNNRDNQDDQDSWNNQEKLGRPEQLGLPDNWEDQDNQDNKTTGTTSNLHQLSHLSQISACQP